MLQRRIKGIDGLRGMFAFLIIFYHYWGNTSGYFSKGYLGVDFFFIVSGFFWMQSMVNGQYVSGGAYLKRCLRKYWPVTTCTYASLIIFNFIFSGWNWVHLKQIGVHLLYEIFYAHLVGISSGSYVISYMWYITVMIFVLFIFTSLYIWNRDIFLQVFLPIAIVGCCTYIFSIWGNLADFRGINKGDIFIKGVYRGVMDIGIGGGVFITSCLCLIPCLNILILFGFIYWRY